MTNPTQAQIDKLTTNLGRWDDIVNGAETDTVTLDNSTVKTVSGYLAELKAYNSLGAWQTAYSYSVKDVVSESSVLYVCLVTHTSGTFSTDLSSGKWAILQTDFQNLNVSGTFSGTFTGDLTGNVTGDVTGTATNSTHVFVVDNESENENNLIPFIEDGNSIGNVGLESDGDFYYNPSTGTLTATLFEGTLSTASQTNITSVGTLTSLTVSGDATFDISTLKVDSTNGRVGIGTSSPISLMHLATSGGSTILTMQRTNTNTTGSIGDIIFNASDNHTVAGIRALADGDNEGSHLIFGTTTGASGNGFSTIYERMRIPATGGLAVNNTNDMGGQSTGHGFLMTNNSQLIMASSGQTVAYWNRTDSSGGTVHDFRLNGVNKGSISVSTTATSYNTSSDYRLKENVTNIDDAVSRLMKLKPSRFNFLENKNEIVDGFLAHEVQDIIPESVTGKKDAVDEEGNPEYQAIDQSKIVPLLVASVQELKRELDALKT